MAQAPDKKLIGAFRDFAATGYLTQGLDFLRKNHAPKISRGTVDQMMHDALSVQGYMAALDDIENILTSFQKAKPEDDDTLSL